MIRKRGIKMGRITHTLSLAFLLLLPFPAGAQGYPARPIRIIVPYAAGGNTDITARTVGAKLTDAFDKILASAELKERFINDGLEPIGGTPEEFGKFIRAEIEKYAKVVKAAGLQGRQ